jgi:hypothetical protein
MNKGLIRGLGVMTTILFALWASSVSGQNYIQSFDKGQIDWSNGIVEAIGVGMAPADTANPAQSRAIAKSQAESSARSNLYELIADLRVDSKNNVKTLLDRQSAKTESLKQSLQQLQLVDISYLEDGSVKATVAFHMNGSFAEVVLPEDIMVIETVLQPERPRKEDEPFTGLVVDCSGFPVEPAMVPSIVDEDGKVVYGAAYASRDYAVERGMIAYARNLDSSQKNPRVGPRPLNVQGIRTAKTGLSDIVISNADASKIRGSPSNLRVMQKCRVVIVLD